MAPTAARPLASSWETLQRVRAGPELEVPQDPAVGVRVGDLHVTATEQLKNSRKHTRRLADKKQEVPQQGPVQRHRLLDIASSPGVLVSATLAAQTCGTPRGRGGRAWGLLCCRGLGHRWAVCRAGHRAPHPQAVLFQQHRGHITIPVRWARDWPLHRHLHRAGKRLERQLEGAPN